MFSKPLLPAVIWAFFILVLMVMPGNNLPEKSWLAFAHLDKLVHFLLFLILGVLLLPGIYKRGLSSYSPQHAFKLAVVTGLSYAMLTEAIQWLFLSNREGSIWDVAADMAGLLTGLGLAIWLSRRQNCRLCRLFGFVRE